MFECIETLRKKWYSTRYNFPFILHDKNTVYCIARSNTTRYVFERNVCFGLNASIQLCDWDGNNVIFCFKFFGIMGGGVNFWILTGRKFKKTQFVLISEVELRGPTLNSKDSISPKLTYTELSLLMPIKIDRKKVLDYPKNN